MKLPPLPSASSSHILLLSVFSSTILHCFCQQQYLNYSVYECSFNLTTKAGYICNGLKKACPSFVTFKSIPPYDTPLRISNLFSSEASSIASINNISTNNDNISPNRTVIVPTYCSCSGNIYQHATSYEMEKGDYYFKLANNTYQGLVNCQMLVRQNYYLPENISIGAQVSVPILCACPTAKEISDGVASLLVHTFDYGDSLGLVAESYGVDQQSLISANELPSLNATISASTPILVPLKPSSCRLNPHMFYCTCSFSQLYYSNSSFSNLNCGHLQSDTHGFPIKLVASIGVGSGAGFLCLFLLGYKLHHFIKQKRETVRKERLFRQNGGHLLQEKMSNYGNRDSAKLFTAEELERATDNYNQNRFLGQGGYGTVYKGMLPDGTIVAVKKSREIARNQIDTFVNEVVILSQINHRNIVKLIGCCLETEKPLLVYEFISNGTLSHNIHTQDLKSKLSWDNRFRIACEVAGAVAYMHFAASIPIFHRDIKTSNILLDHNSNAKVSDFGSSRSVPNDKTHLTTAVQGTFGYIDPVYFQTSQFTDKSDVYSFGVVLVELITGRKPFLEQAEGQSLVAEFISLMKNDQVLEILDAKVVREGGIECILGIANLALRCLRLNRSKRPTMREVSTELEAMRNTQNVLEITECSDEFPIEEYTTSSFEANQEITEQSMPSFLQMDSTSI